MVDPARLYRSAALVGESEGNSARRIETRFEQCE